MKGTMKSVRAFIVLLAGACFVSVCGARSDDADSAGHPAASSVGSDTARPGNASTGIVLVGDGGYHLRYADEPVANPVSVEAFLDEYRDWFAQIGTVDVEAQLPPYYTFEPSGHTVLASGLEPVATAVTGFCGDDRRCDFGFQLGDNIYPRGATAGADGIDDRQRFKDIFIKPYAALFDENPTFRFDVVLGNHDWYTSLAGARSQLAFHESHPNYHMDGWFYRTRHDTPAGGIDVFALDTQMLLSTVPVPEPVLDENGDPAAYARLEILDSWVTEHAMTQGDQVAWLTEALEASDARWKIVIGHHPLWSSAGWKFQQARALRRLLLPALCSNADMYVAGHDHTLEVHEQSCKAYTDATVSPLLHIVSGAGSKQRAVHEIFARRQADTVPGFKALWYQGMIWGFAHLKLAGDDGTVTLITTGDDGSGRPTVVFEHEFPRRSADLRQE